MPFVPQNEKRTCNRWENVIFSAGSMDLVEHNTNVVSQYDAVYIDTCALMQVDQVKSLVRSLKRWCSEQGGRLRVRPRVLSELSGLSASSPIAKAALNLIETQSAVFFCEEGDMRARHFRADTDFYSLLVSHCEQRNQLLITRDTGLAEMVGRIDAQVKSPVSPYHTRAAKLENALLHIEPTAHIELPPELLKVLKSHTLYMDAAALEHPSSLRLLRSLAALLSAHKQSLHFFGETWQILRPEVQHYVSALLGMHLRVHELQPQRREYVALCAELPLCPADSVLISGSLEMADSLLHIWPGELDKEHINQLIVWCADASGKLCMRGSTPAKTPPKEAAPKRPAPAAKSPAANTLKDLVLAGNMEGAAAALATASVQEISVLIDESIRNQQMNVLAMLAECDRIASNPQAAVNIISTWLKTHISKKKGAMNAFKHPACIKYYCKALEKASPDFLKKAGRELTGKILDEIAKTASASNRLALWRAYLFAQDAGAPAHPSAAKLCTQFNLPPKQAAS